MGRTWDLLKLERSSNLTSCITILDSLESNQPVNSLPRHNNSLSHAKNKIIYKNPLSAEIETPSVAAYYEKNCFVQ